MESETIGDRFKMVREDLGLSIRWLSRTTKEPRESIVMMENGKKPFSAEFIARACQILDTDIWVKG
jgi:predicted transcriptional regulator